MEARVRREERNKESRENKGGCPAKPCRGGGHDDVRHGRIGAVMASALTAGSWILVTSEGSTSKSLPGRSGGIVGVRSWKARRGQPQSDFEEQQEISGVDGRV